MKQEYGRPVLSPKFDPISIIMPVYNNLQYTENFFNSFYKHNSGLDYELIVIDNASTDDTPNYLKDLAGKDGRIKIITNEKNMGVSSSWNQGIKESNHDYIAIVNNDIEFMIPNCFKEMQKTLKKRDDIYWTSPRTCYAKEGYVSYKVHHFEQLLYGTSNTSYIVGCCIMLPRRAFDELGMFDEQFEMKFYEDLDFINRILQAKKRVSMSPATLVYHVRGASRRGTPGGWENEKKYEEKWKDTEFDILAKQPSRQTKAIKHFDFTKKD